MKKRREFLLNLPETGQIGVLARILEKSSNKNLFFKVMNGFTEYKTLKAAEKATWWKKTIKTLEDKLGRDKSIEIVKACGAFMTPKEIVTAYWKEMNNNDYCRAAEYLTDDFSCKWPQSSECIEGKDNFIAINTFYPSEGNWTFEINRIQAEDDQVVTDVSISDGTIDARAITFFTISFGKIRELIEYWPENYKAPEWRKPWICLIS